MATLISCDRGSCPLKTGMELEMDNAVELIGDALEFVQLSLDRLVAEGAAHAALVVTYPDGQQVVLKGSAPAECSGLPKAACFR